MACMPSLMVVTIGHLAISTHVRSFVASFRLSRFCHPFMSAAEKVLGFGPNLGPARFYKEDRCWGSGARLRTWRHEVVSHELHDFLTVRRVRPYDIKVVGIRERQRSYRVSARLVRCHMRTGACSAACRRA